MDESKAKPIVSVIVPVYKVEKYVARCIDSILNQTYPNWELILVDDGSPDDSGSICDEYAAKDNRIRVFHKENGGVSSARNLGIEKSTGNLLMFVDSDDWINTQCIEQCLNKAADSDLIRFGLQYIFKGKDIPDYILRINESLSLNEYRKLLVSRKTALGVCGGMYRRSIFFQHRIRFNESIIMGEDWLVNFQYLKHCSSVCIIDKPFYTYNRSNEDGCTNNYSISKDLQMIKVAQFILDDNLLSTKEYAQSKTECKINVYYQTLTHLLSGCKSFKQLYLYTKDVNSFTIAPTLSDIIHSKTKWKEK